MDDAQGRDGPQFYPGTLIDFGDLEQQLSRLWQPDDEAQAVSPGLATHLNVLNLVIYANDHGTGANARKVAEQLSAIHPCRAIVFSATDPVELGNASPEVYSTCQRDEDGSQSPCIELIHIPVPAGALSHVRSLIEPTVIPGLPTFVWWPGSPVLEDPAVTAIASQSDRFIIDSLSFVSIRQLHALHRLRLDLPACVATDLNWHRLQPWRELTAQYFDIRNVQWALQHIREVEIEAGQNSVAEVPAQALLFGSWLAHCLGWQLAEARRTRRDGWYISMRDQRGKPVDISVRTRPTSNEYAGQMLSFTMTARDDTDQSSSLSLSHGRRSELIRMHAKSGLDTALHHVVPHPNLPDVALLMRVLETTDRDHVFDEALTHAITILNYLERPVSE